MDHLQDLKFVFKENVSDKDITFDRAFQNFIDYMESLNKHSRKMKYTEAVQRNIVNEIDECMKLLRQKAIDPKNVCTTFAIW